MFTYLMAGVIQVLISFFQQVDLEPIEQNFPLHRHQLTQESKFKKFPHLQSQTTVQQLKIIVQKIMFKNFSNLKVRKYYKIHNYKINKHKHCWC